jgi:hypothetical protein
MMAPYLKRKGRPLRWMTKRRWKRLSGREGGIMSTVEINNTHLDMRVEADEKVAANHKSVEDLFDKLKQWGAMAELKEAVLERAEGNPLLYSYKIEKKDGRQSLVTFLFEDQADTDPLMAIDVDPAWKISEMEAGSVVRAAFLDIRQRFGLVLMEVEWA